MTCSANIRHKTERNHLSLFWTQFQFTNGPGCHPSTAYARWVCPPGWFLPPRPTRSERFSLTFIQELFSLVHFPKRNDATLSRPRFAANPADEKNLEFPTRFGPTTPGVVLVRG